MDRDVNTAMGGRSITKAGKATKVGLEICPVFTRWQVHCRKWGPIFNVDTEPESSGYEILKLGDIRCGLHPSQSAVIELV